MVRIAIDIFPALATHVPKCVFYVTHLKQRVIVSIRVMPGVGPVVHGDSYVSTDRELQFAILILLRKGRT